MAVTRRAENARKYQVCGTHVEAMTIPTMTVNSRLEPPERLQVDQLDVLAASGSHVGSHRPIVEFGSHPPTTRQNASPELWTAGDARLGDRRPG
jgi:hypothetical protein